MGWFSKVLKVVGAAALGAVGAAASVATGGLAAPLAVAVVAGAVAGGGAAAAAISHGQEPTYGIQVTAPLPPPAPAPAPAPTPAVSTDPIHPSPQSPQPQPPSNVPPSIGNETGPVLSATIPSSSSTNTNPPPDLIHFPVPGPFPNPRPNSPTPSPSSSTPSQGKYMKEYQEKLKSLENSLKAGRDDKTGLWFPHKDHRGIPTIGYGHEIQNSEDFSKGLTDNEVEALFQEDFKIHESRANRDFDSAAAAAMAKNSNEKVVYSTWKMVPEVIQAVAIDITYNVGNLSSFPSFMQAVRTDNKEEMINQCVNNPDSTVAGVIARNKWRQDFIRMNYKQEQDTKSIPFIRSKL